MTTIAIVPNRQISVEGLRKVLPSEQFVLADDTGDPAILGRAEVMLGSNGAEPEALISALTRAPAIRWFASISAGAERLIETGIVGRPGLVVTTNRGTYDIPIADHVIALIYAAARNLHLYARAQRDRKWIRIAARTEIRDTTLAVYGLGSIGSEIARQAAALGLRVIGVRRAPGPPPPGVARCVGPDALGDVVAEADHVVLSAPLTPATRGAISKDVIARMRPSAWLINIARGGLIDEAALVTALREGRIGGAALDVFETEPLPADSPLWSLENVIVTPHSAITSPNIAERTMRAFAQNLGRFQRGEPLANVVDARVGY